MTAEAHIGLLVWPFRRDFCSKRPGDGLALTKRCANGRLGSCSNRDVVAARKLEAVGYIAGSAAARVDSRRDANELDFR